MIFSFVIPTYNRSQKVKRAIQSVLQQYNWTESCEIVVVDDGSTDDTEEVLKEYFQNGQIRLIKHVENRGVAAAKNTGVINAQNEFVVLLDSDDLLDENTLPYMKQLVSENSYDVFFMGTKILAQNRLMYDPEFIGLKSYSDLLKTRVGEYLPVCRTRIMKDNLLKNLRGYESITWLILARSGYKVYFDNKPVRLYDDSGDDRLSNRFSAIKNAFKMREGYTLYLKEFGKDLRYCNYPEYIKVNVKLFCYYLMSVGFRGGNQPAK